MIDLTSQRLRMVRDQIAARGVRNSAVLDAMRRVPREAFLPAELSEFAYRDTPLPIEGGQTISQPYIVVSLLKISSEREFSQLREFDIELERNREADCELNHKCPNRVRDRAISDAET